MIYLGQLGIILGVSFVGEALHALIPLPVPASVYGLAVMLGLLLSGLLKPAHVRATAAWLIGLMPLMFVPAAAGLMDSWKQLTAILAPFLIICAVSTLVVMAVTGRVTQCVLRWESRRGGREGRI